mgnify:FL=1
MEIMKALLENWRKHMTYLKKHPYMEPDGLQEKIEDKVITFDFDDTLSLSHWGDEEDDWVHDGPHLPMIKRYKKYKDQGYKVYIVTSRHQEFLDDENQWYTYLPSSTPNKKYFPEFQMPVEKFVKEYNLDPEAVIFTNGSLKVNVLKKLQSAIHHDDDVEEIKAAEEAGIKTVLSDPYKNTSVTENNESQDSKKVSKVVIRDDEGKVLILQRSEGENNWDLPGGHIHYGESQLDGCKRETKEETNLDLSDLKLVDKDRNVTFYQAPRPVGTIKLQPEEHIKYKWINPRDISGVDMRHNLKSAINKAVSVEEQTEDFQKAVKQNHRKMKIRLIGGGKNKYNVGGKMKKPSYKRSKSAPIGFGGSLE